MAQLVPVLAAKKRVEERPPRVDWAHERLPARTVKGDTYRIDRHRPRVEGLFARIERWTNCRMDTG
ncbi:SpvB/TcaC N-terminal domain-containing protein [Nonomuraea thailandensis]